MQTLVDRYLTLYRQGFVPIFVADRFDAVQLADACAMAGAAAVEITCRRRNVCDDIRRVRRAHPGLLILAGSTMDDGAMLAFLRRRRPDMPTLSQLADLGVDGFVSAMPLSPTTIGRWSATHLLMPGIETPTEAVRAVEAGAHFAKFFTASTSGADARIATVTSAALHHLLPTFVTGGVTRERIAAYVKARTALLGSGWDVLAADAYERLQDDPDTQNLAARLASFLTEMAAARRVHQPDLLAADGTVSLDRIPHYHAFSQG